MDNSPRLVEISVRLYRVLIGVYPKSFRRDFGDEMTQVFRDMIAEAWRGRGTIGVLRIWVRVLFDLAGTLPREHWRQLCGGFKMKAVAFAVFSVVVSTSVYLTIFYMLMMAAIGFFYCLWGSQIGEHLLEMQRWVVAGAVLVFIPAFLTGLIVSRVNPFYRPVMTAPAGIMLFWGIVSSPADNIPQWWMRVGFVAAIGLTAALGCAASAGLTSHRTKTSPPPEDLLPSS